MHTSKDADPIPNKGLSRGKASDSRLNKTQTHEGFQKHQVFLTQLKPYLHQNQKLIEKKATELWGSAKVFSQSQKCSYSHYWKLVNWFQISPVK